MRDHLERLVFIDETSLKTNMTKTCGWAPIGDRLIDPLYGEKRQDVKKNGLTRKGPYGAVRHWFQTLSRKNG